MYLFIYGLLGLLREKGFSDKAVDLRSKRISIPPYKRRFFGRICNKRYVVALRYKKFQMRAAKKECILSSRPILFDQS